MRKYLIPFFLLLLLFGCMGSRARLSVSLSQPSPAQPYEGDEMTFNVTVANSGAAEAKDFTLDFFVDNVSVKTEVVTLAPNSSKTLSFSWFPYSAGDYEVVTRADSGNLVSDASTSKESRTIASVKPSEEVDIFSAFPKRENLMNIGTFDINKNGLNFLNNYSRTMGGLPTYFALIAPYVKNMKEVKIGTVDYSDTSKGIIALARGAMSLNQFSKLLSLLTNTTFSTQTLVINGRSVLVLTASEGYSIPLCVWREKGWLKFLFYENMDFSQTCVDVIGEYDSSTANSLLSQTHELLVQPPFNTTVLGETEHVSNLTRTEYGAAFEDEEGFYGAYVAKEPYNPQDNICFGRIANRSMMQVCELLPTESSTWTWVQRKIGNYSMICLSIPKSNESSIAIEMKALDICYSFNFSGGEITWRRAVDLLIPRCELPGGFRCLSYDFTNSTLKLNITQETGKSMVLYGFKCSSEFVVPATHFQLTAPITIASNSSVILEYPCYDESDGMLKEATAFNTRIYLNYSSEGNESKVAVGNLTIRKI